MVCALADTTGTSILTKKSGSKMLHWLQTDLDHRGKPPKERLAEFDVLLEKSLSEAGLKLTEQQEKDIRRLHEYFRNRFSHFIPMGWGIQKAGLPRMIGTALYAVQDLMGRGRAATHFRWKRSATFPKS
jgi:hypothetical protein